MNAIEADFAPLQGSLPKNYERFDNKLVENLLRCFDSEALHQATGDVFGRIYEYFLMKFAIQGAQDNGEFFTPRRWFESDIPAANNFCAAKQRMPAAELGAG